MRLFHKEKGFAIDVSVGGRSEGSVFPSAVMCHNNELYPLPILWVNSEEEMWYQIGKFAAEEGFSEIRPAGWSGKK